MQMQGGDNDPPQRSQDGSIDIASLPNWMLRRLNLRREADVGWRCRESPYVAHALAVVVGQAGDDLLPRAIVLPAFPGGRPSVSSEVAPGLTQSFEAGAWINISCMLQ